MKKQLSKKFSAFIVIVMMFSASANAQIVYTDVNPDVYGSSSLPASGYNTHYYYLDLNNDGVNDFIITASTHKHDCYGPLKYDYARVYITALDSNFIGTTGVSAPLIINTRIDANSGWTQGSPILKNCTHNYHINTNFGCEGTTYNCSGTWGYGLLGLKIKSAANTYYGWIQLAVGVSSYANSASFTIMSYAYNSIPNQPILAGEITCATPIVNLTQSGSLSFCAGDSVTFTANGTGYQYQWKKNNVNITGATSKAYIAKTAGVYKCKVTNSCGNKTSGTRTVTVPCRSSNENISETLEHLSVYPNPATNSVTIKFPSDEEGEIQVVNLFGQIVFSEKINDEQIQIDASKFSEGVYIVRWSSGENFETKTFSVVK